MKGPFRIRKGTGGLTVIQACIGQTGWATWVYETVTPLLPWGKLYLSD